MVGIRCGLSDGLCGPITMPKPSTHRWICRREGGPPQCRDSAATADTAATGVDAKARGGADPPGHYGHGTGFSVFLKATVQCTHRV